MLDIIYCCPVCGRSSYFLLDKTHCPSCGKCFGNIDIYKAKHNYIYYCEEAKKRFPPDEVGHMEKKGEYRWIEILEEEVAQNPLFDKEIYESRIKAEQEEWESRPKYVPKPLNSNLPKCPTCGSTNIKKISDTAKVAGALMFGLLSKTAKSQFKCNNCGYKW